MKIVVEPLGKEMVIAQTLLCDIRLITIMGMNLLFNHYLLMSTQIWQPNLTICIKILYSRALQIIFRTSDYGN